MTGFDYTLEKIHTDALKLDYFLVPWDTEILGRPVAEIKRLEIMDSNQAIDDYRYFTDWCIKQGIVLCSARLNHGKLAESMFLEARGFRFIEMNYRPRLTGLQALTFGTEDIEIALVQKEDHDFLIDQVAKTFGFGRFHQDARIGSEMGNKRYQVWIRNSFSASHQTVYKCLHNDKIIGFFVVEYPDNNQCFWSLVGILPEYQGQGFGRSVWRAMLRWNQQQGVDIVSTSISSHNVAVFNLYVPLGFRFPEPQMTFHWVTDDPNNSKDV